MNETNLENDRDWQQAEMARDEAWRIHEIEEAFKRIYNGYYWKGFESHHAFKEDWELLARELGILKFYKSL